jgi:hypothetical protein
LAVYSLSVTAAACKSTPPPARSAKVDVHSHFVPDFYADALKEAGHVPGPDGMPGIPVSSSLLKAMTSRLTLICRVGMLSLIWSL